VPDYKLPDVGEGLTEAEIVTWKVKVGDVIAINDIVVEIETAKSLVELPSPYAGTVTALHVAEGETVDVGTPIISVGDPVEAGGSPTPVEPVETQAPAAIDLSNPAASGGGEGESLVGRNKAEREALRRPRKAASAAVQSTHQQVQASFVPGELESPPVVEADEPAVPAYTPDAPAEQSASNGDVRALAKPPVRKLAKDLGVDISALVGSGRGGVVTREDVQTASRTPAEPSEAQISTSSIGGGAGSIGGGAGSTDGQRERREPIKGVRKMMGQAMVDSAFTAPHVTEWVTVDVTRTMDFVERLKTRREFREVKVSPLLVLARAVVLAARRTPEINSFWDDRAQEVVFKSYVNLGIAAATERGLVVPNVKDAQDLSLLELAAALNQLTATAREGRTQPADMSGGTFTITNVGVFGIDAGTPIINPGESAILAFGAVRKQPWVLTEGGEDRIEIRQVTTLALSFDHRHVDGEKGSRFLADVAAIMEDPAAALLF
jgi:2-oxoisovalerate dehydrogenase E2 component (dihydrolipoyl transacylase)